MRYLLVCVGMLWVLGTGAHDAVRRGESVFIGAKPRLEEGLKPGNSTGGDTVNIQQMPRFRDGNEDQFRRWIALRVGYPEQARRLRIEGTVLLRFIVDTDGTLTDLEILETPHHSLSEAVLDVARTSPRWTPGMVGQHLKDGTWLHPVTAVKVRLVVPVKFALDTGPASPSLPGQVNRFTARVLNYDQADSKPRFDGRGAESFGEWLAANAKMPAKLKKSGFEGNVGVIFVVETDGSMSSVQVLNAPEQLAEALKNAMRKAPLWSPGTASDGTPARVRIVQTIRYPVAK